MPTPLIPQEIYLLERYTTLEYFGEMRDAWDAMVTLAENCLAEYVRHLPPDYRSRPLPEQPDITWGEVVLPNFRYTRQSLMGSYIEISHGDMDALGSAGNVRSAVTGQQSDYPPFWMTDEQQSKYYALMGVASEHARNISATVDATWKAGNLAARYHAPSRGPLNPPQWPTYRLNPSIKVITGKAVPKTGCYLPEIDDSCAAFMIAGEEAWPANVGYDETTMQNISEDPTTWTLIERVSDTGVPSTPSLTDAVRLRCAANHPCPKEGWWFTPAKADSRRHFKQGETMPDLGSAWGSTIWQWDENQS